MMSMSMSMSMRLTAGAFLVAWPMAGQALAQQIGDADALAAPSVHIVWSSQGMVLHGHLVQDQAPAALAPQLGLTFNASGTLRQNGRQATIRLDLPGLERVEGVLTWSDDNAGIWVGGRVMLVQVNEWSRAGTRQIDVLDAVTQEVITVVAGEGWQDGVIAGVGLMQAVGRLLDVVVPLADTTCDPSFEQCKGSAEQASAPGIRSLRYSCDPQTGAVSCAWESNPPSVGGGN